LKPLENGWIKQESQQPWSSFLEDFIHPEERGGVEMVQAVLRHFGIPTADIA
jgi:hypothetical protein